MRKTAILILIVLLFVSVSVQCQASTTGTVTAGCLNMRKSATTDSKVIKVLREGNKVTILSTSGSWYKIQFGSSTGYVSKKYVKTTSSSNNKSSGSSSSSSSGTCSPGDHGENVKKIQKRLKTLGYYTGSIDGDYGNGTKTAVKNFQRVNGLNSNGYVNQSTLQKLNSSSAKKAGSASSSGSSSGTCAPGDSGDQVKKVQKRLRALGYYSGSIDGDYGNGTKTAVKEFQRTNGLSVNGTVNSSTLNKLNSSSAQKASSSSENGSGTEQLNWFRGGSSKIPKGATFKVKDIKTGKVFTCKRWSGSNHLDAEPLTASDTATMKSIFGHWSWRRRAILVKYNGHVYAASMNGMPHGTQTIKNNKFEGHFCIHFSGSKTHGSGKVDSVHQNCVKTALKHSW